MHLSLRLRNDLYCVEWGVKLYSLTQVLSHFKYMQKFCFQYQFVGKGLVNNFGPSVKHSGKKN